MEINRAWYLPVIETLLRKIVTRSTSIGSIGVMKGFARRKLRLPLLTRLLERRLPLTSHEVATMLTVTSTWEVYTVHVVS